MTKLKFYLAVLALCLVAVGCEKTHPQPEATNTQFVNSTFEEGWDSNNECTGWHSFATAIATGPVLAAARNTEQLGPSSEPRPGSTGTKSARISAKSILSVIANGNLTTGRINAGSTFATSPNNFNATRLDGVVGGEDIDSNILESNKYFYNQMPNKPDSLVAWVKYNNASNLITDSARVAAHIHGVKEGHDSSQPIFKDPSTDADNNALIVGSAILNYTATSDKGWQRISVPFKYLDNGVTPKYILCTFTTNKTPGKGHKDDIVLIDDIELIYN